MKKLLLLALTLPILGLTFLGCTDAGDPYVPPVPGLPTLATAEIEINDTVGAWDTDGLYIRGTLTGDQDMPMSQNGIMWMVAVEGLEAGTYAYTIYTDDGSKAEEVVLADQSITVSSDLVVSGDTEVDLEPTADSGFRLLVTNLNTENYDNIKLKGSWDDWATVERSGQSEDGITVYRNLPGDLEDGTYNWGVIHDDGSEWGVWLVEGPDLAFTVASGVVTGDLTYTIPAPLPPEDMIDFTVNCDMNDYLSSYDVVGLRGSFNGWETAPTVLTDVDADGIYSVTVSVAANSTIVFKFVLDGATYEDVPSECGADDGYGGFNREFTVGAEATSFTAPFAGCPAGF